MALDDHAYVRLGGKRIPLVGLPPSATEQACEVCGQVVNLRDTELNAEGKQFLCWRCRHPEVDLTGSGQVG